MRLSCTLLLIITAITTLSAQRWLPGELILDSGDTIRGKIKWRENLGEGVLKIKVDGEKSKYSADQISELFIEDKKYMQIKLDQLQGKPVLLARQLNDHVFTGWFKEIRCLCDNSFNIVRAYFLEADDKWIVLRKRALKDAFVIDEAAGESFLKLDDISFSEFPDFYNEQFFEQ